MRSAAYPHVFKLLRLDQMTDLPLAYTNSRRKLLWRFEPLFCMDWIGHAKDDTLRSRSVPTRAVFSVLRAALRAAIHSMISERDQASRPLIASGSPILKERGNLFCL